MSRTTNSSQVTRTRPLSPIFHTCKGRAMGNTPFWVTFGGPDSGSKKILKFWKIPPRRLTVDGAERVFVKTDHSRSRHL
ncbi:hypothetical protein TNCV_4456311 [Trichonephila clavipes]|nr:hypothetical protein TNCV_4456311 [Trichonephila clavipes]